ncbi:amidase signature domain protein [Rhypophila decipiens]|uniref:Amidase signature domain protein n=1 Tax=Rhypophila decipiens TaxID=261697 RepID=A0AAN7B569_9PEZI|nr:amidase signature domain protein [Rhypophila decipiens]
MAMDRLRRWAGRRAGGSSSSDFAKDIDEVFTAGDSRRFVAIDGADFALSAKRGPTLITVIHVDANTPRIERDWLEEYIANMNKCPVYDPSVFLVGLVVIAWPSQTKRPMTKEARRFLEELGNEWVEFAKPGQVYSPGPYMYTNGLLKPVLRLFADHQSAILTPLSNHDGMTFPYVFEPLMTGGGQHPGRLSIGVYSTAARHVQSSLDGAPTSPLRIVVKDCYFLKGMKNTICNSAYYDFIPDAPFTATVVDPLIENVATAHVMGIAKLSTMIGREEPMDAVDFPIAFNPRGDGYQSPAGSSSGSAVAVASYDFVDAAIGTDTSGSGRRPALFNGVWQFRPTHHDSYLRGMITTYPRFDTPCVFARDLKILKQVARLVYPSDYFPVSNKAQMELIDSFVRDVGSSTSLPFTIRKLNIRGQWAATHPEGTPDDLDDFEPSTRSPHGGRPPYVNAFIQQRWDKGAAVTSAENKEAEHRMEVYRQWWLTTIFGQENEKEVLIILPIANVGPNYRDEVVASPTKQSALDQLFLGPILGAPDVMVPLGDVPYESRISKRTEYLPVVVDLVGAPGSDLRLLEAVERLMREAGREMLVSTGTRMFPGRG